MSFLHASRLWLLAGVVALVLVHVAVQVRGRRALARYTSAHLAPVVVPRRLGWRRHVPIGLALAALALIVVGLAQPTRAEAVPREEGVVILAVDVSASMDANDVEPSRLAAAIEGASEFVKKTPAGIHLGLVAFDGSARVVVNPTTDHDLVGRAVLDLTTGPGTAAGEAVYASLDAVRAALTPAVLDQAEESGDDLPAAIVLLSDGVTTVGRPVEQAATEAADTGVPVTTIAFGTPQGVVFVQGELVRVPADPQTMEAVAEVTGGRFHEAETASELHEVYDDIQTAVGYRTEQREVTRAFLGVAVALLVGAGALSVAWFGRVL